MATIKNTIDKALQAYTPSRLTTTGVFIVTTASTFFTAKNTNIVTPSTVSLSASIVGYTSPTYTWYYSNSANLGTWVSMTAITAATLTNSTFKSHLGTSSTFVRYKVVVSQSGWSSTESYIDITYTEQANDVPILIFSKDSISLPTTQLDVCTYTGAYIDIGISIGGTNITYATSGANTFSVAVGTIVGTAIVTPSGTGTLRTLTISGMNSTGLTSIVLIPVTITAIDSRGVSTVFTKNITVSKVTSGTTGTSGTSVFVGKVYYRGTTTPTVNASTGSYNFATNTLTVPTGNVLWLVSQPASTTDPTYVTSFTFSTTTPSTTVTAGTWSTPIVEAVNGGPGTSGEYRDTIQLYISAATAPTKPISIPYTFTGNTIGTQNGGTLTWSLTQPATPVYTSAVYLTTCPASTTTPASPVTLSNWSNPVIVAQKGAPGAASTVAGPSGATAVYAYKVVTGTSLPSSPAVPSGAVSGTATTGGAWAANPKSPLASNDWQFMASGTNLSGAYTWTSPSYLATFKIGKLSALSADMGKITAGEMAIGTGSTPRGATIEITSTGVFWADNIFSKIGSFGNPSGSYAAVRGTSENGCTGEGLWGLAAVNNIAAHGVRGQNITKGTSGLVGVANGYNFYADGLMAIGDYGTFTGAHDALLLIGHTVEPGDILVDKLVISRGNISNTISEVAISSITNQKGVVGVFTGSLGILSEQFLPNALLGSRTYITHLDGEKETINTPVSIYDSIKDSYEYVVMNSLGEGQINVCGEGGNIEIGDLIVSSSISGKGMKQANDTIYSYTVAKSRENVVFSSNSDIKMVACIYLCG
jgi:hypothetical protein